MTRIATPPVEPPSPPPRPWWRLHGSTWAVAALMAALLVWANLTEFSRLDVRFPKLYVEAGWPWACSRTTKARTLGILDAHSLVGVALCGNVAVGLAITTLAAAVVEWRRRRRNGFWQLTLGELLLATAFVACLLGWYQKLRARHVAQQAASQVLSERGLMNVRFHSSLPDWVQSQAPEWMHGALEPFRSAKKLTIGELFTEVHGFEPLVELTTLEGLESYAFPEGGNIDDADAAYLGQLHKLTCLRLSGAAISDAGLAELQELTRLEELHLGRTRVTGKGMHHLTGMRRLESLHLSGLQIDDAALANLEHLSKLQVLDLSNTRVTDEGLRHLANLDELWELNLYGTQVSDEGLRHLYGLDGLDWLLLEETNVTADGIRRMQAAMPHLTHVWPVVE